MLHDIAEVYGLSPCATDGEIGTVDDAYFSDDIWTVRFLVIDTGGWLTGRKVLVTPRSVQRLDVPQGVLQLALTREQIRKSPDYDSDKPVSRQYEADYYTYYGYPYYWSGPYLWGASDYPIPPGAPVGGPAPGADEEVRVRMERERAKGDPHLRSSKEVSGYAIEAIDGDLGHVETFLFDDATWRIAAVVIDTRNWWPGKHVVVSPMRIEAIDWSERRVRLSLTRERIKAHAEYEPRMGSGDERDERVRRIEHALHFGD